MLAPKNLATCSHGAKPKKPGIHIATERAKASPEQLAAWRRLWAKLLAVPTTTPAADMPNEEQASIHRPNERIGYQENENDQLLREKAASDPEVAEALCLLRPWVTGQGQDDATTSNGK